MAVGSKALAIGWAAAWIALAILTAAITAAWTAFYAAGGIELPWITVVAVSIGEMLRGPFGWLVFAALLALGLLPLYLGVGGDDHRRWLKLGIVQAGVAALLLWATLELPLMPLQVMFQTDAARAAYEAARPRPPLEFVGRSALFTAPGVLILTFLQVAAWIPIAVRVVSLPRVRLQEEALRASVLAILPAVALAIGSYLVVDELRLSPSTGLVVSPSLAAAGTAVAITYGVVLWFRLRRPEA